MTLPRHLRFPLILLALLAAATLLLARPRAASPTGPSLRATCKAAGLKYPPPAPRVEIHKAERVLHLFSGSTRLKSYRVGLGFHPTGDKRREGDGRTPEGRFYVCTRLRRSKFHRFLGLSYPAPEDAAAAVRAGAITAQERAQIDAAHRTRRQPPWNTALGGAVGIHGKGSATDWTLGCIAVEDPEIEELSEALPLGTPVRIIP